MTRISGILCAVATVIAVMAFHQRPAQAKEAAWCAVLSMGEDAVYWDCQYRSFDDCLPHLFEGNRGFCNQNPRYQSDAQPARPRSSRRHRE
jgi:uncharacterized protein DUF3551